MGKVKVKKTKRQPKVQAESSDESDTDYAPAYQEVSEDEDWADDDLAVEAVELMLEQEEFEKDRTESSADSKVKPKKSKKEKTKSKPVEPSLVEKEEEEEEEVDVFGDIDNAEDDEDDSDFGEDDDEGEDIDDEDVVMESDAESEEQKLDGEEDDQNESDADNTNYGAELKKLMASDPDFRKFIEQEDKDLLDIDEESDDDAGDGRVQVTNEMVNNAYNYLTNFNVSSSILHGHAKFAVKAFSACLMRVTTEVIPSKYIVRDDGVFDNVVRLAYGQLAPVLFNLLEPVEVKSETSEENGDSKGHKKKADPKLKFKQWKKFSPLVKEFLRGLGVMLREATSDEILYYTLRAIIDSVGLFVHFDKMTRLMIKSLVRVWSRKTQNCRCLAFMAMCKFIRLDSKLFPVVFKNCYVAYVANTRLVSLDSLPLISFMQKSFAELTFIDATVAYQYAFVYIRQSAIHLRNATISKRKDLVKTIYNWQYIQCLYLWTVVLSMLAKRRIAATTGGRWIRDLVHPLVQIIIGTMKAYNAHRYVPLKAHCVRMLLQIQMNCKVFIPTMEYAADLLRDFSKIDCNRPPKGKGMHRVYEISELIKFNSDAVQEASYRERLAREVRFLLLESAWVLRLDPSFADVYAPVSHQLKKFMKEYKNIKEIPEFKNVFGVLKTHAAEIEQLVNLTELDLKNEKSKVDFRTLANGKCQMLNQLRNAARRSQLIDPLKMASQTTKTTKSEKMEVQDDDDKPKQKKKHFKKFNKHKRARKTAA